MTEAEMTFEGMKILANELTDSQKREYNRCIDDITKVLNRYGDIGEFTLAMIVAQSRYEEEKNET